MSNIIDSIQLSGTVYTIQGTGGGGSPTVELTQAEYDALVSAGTVSANTYYIITDATAGDLTQYWTSAQTQSAINQATSGKVDTSSVVTAVTSGSTDNEIPTAKAVYDAIPSATTYSAGRGIDITNDTISFSLPISAGTGAGSIVEGSYTTAKGNSSHAEGSYTVASSAQSHAEGSFTVAIGDSSHAEGYFTSALTQSSHAEGNFTQTTNKYEHASGQYNVSYSASTTFGDSGNTLFSVGNGTNYARHNAFEIRQNGDIYLTKDGVDIKLQDNLGGTASSAITSGDTNAVAGGAVYDKFDEVEQVTAAALNELAEANEVVARALNDLNDRITAIEEVTARALIDLNDKFDGLRLKKLTQAQYDAISGSTDSNTLYVIVN